MEEIQKTEKQIIEELCVKYNLSLPNCSLLTFVNMLVAPGEPLHHITALYDLATSNNTTNNDILIAMITYGDFDEINIENN